MSKYEPLWNYIVNKNSNSLELSFDDVKNILGYEIDHSFLNYKKELEAQGYIIKISLKNKTINIKKASN
ncbi:MAG: hypothetical protein KBT35_01130 [Firmicutes bacterium]|nr:hypothetical protein [Candidatus Colivicinus equi]